MSRVERIGIVPEWEREVYLLSLHRLSDWPRRLDLPTKYYTLFLACDARGEPDIVVYNFINKALDGGLARLVTWGPECDRLSMAVYEALEFRDLPESSHVMSSWYPDDPLDYALWTFVYASFPCDDYLEEDYSLVAAVIDRPGVAEEIRRRLADIEAFNQSLLDSEEDPSSPAS